MVRDEESRKGVLHYPTPPRPTPRHTVVAQASAAGWPRSVLTVPGNDPQRDGVSGLLDEVDDVGVRLIGDGAPVHGQDAVSHFQLSAAVGWAPFDDAPYFVGHGHTCIASYGQHVDMMRVRVCVCVCVCSERWGREGKWGKEQEK